MFPQSILKAKRQAFTLVEITLALGIVAFAVIVSFGLVSTATQSFHETRRDTVYANILQYVAANANLTPFANLSSSSADGTTPDQNVTLDGKIWKFDMEGLPLADDSKDTPTYYAKAVVSKSPLLPAQELTSTKTKGIIVVISDSGIQIPTTINSSIDKPESLVSSIPQRLREHIVPFYIVVGDMGK